MESIQRNERPQKLLQHETVTSKYGDYVNELERAVMTLQMELRLCFWKREFGAHKNEISV